MAETRNEAWLRKVTLGRPHNHSVTESLQIYDNAAVINRPLVSQGLYAGS